MPLTADIHASPFYAGERQVKLSKRSRQNDMASTGYAGSHSARLVLYSRHQRYESPHRDCSD